MKTEMMTTPMTRHGVSADVPKGTRIVVLVRNGFGGESTFYIKADCSDYYRYVRADSLPDSGDVVVLERISSKTHFWEIVE